MLGVCQEATRGFEMKRSQINDSIRLAIDVLKAHRFELPRWAYWGPANWEHCGPEANEIKARRLGWDVTDFGLSQYREQGMVIFTLRDVRVGQPKGDEQKSATGQPAEPPSGEASRARHEGSAPAGQRTARPLPSPAAGYVERVMFSQVHQVNPMHLHRAITSDLANRGGGDLVIQLYNAGARGGLDEESRVPIHVNGIFYNIRAGGLIRLAPGDSITLPPGLCHKSWPEKAGCLIGEIATPGNPNADTHYVDTEPGPMEIEEDEPALFVLCHEYPEMG
jgi:hypothetical protein